MKKLYRPAIGAALLAFAIFQSCKHDDMPGPSTVKKWEVTLKAIHEVPAPAGRTEEGEAEIELLSDNSLKYNIHIHNLSPSDTLRNAHIHFGNPDTSGNIIIPFDPTFIGSGTTGTVKNLRQGQIDTLTTMPVYVNVHSKQLGAGLARAQLDQMNDFSIDVAMNGANERPNPVTTTATGTAILRLMADKTLYSKVTVTNLEALDTLTAAHIHRGDVNTAGQIRIFLCNNRNEFGIIRAIPLVDSLVNILKNDPCYVNAHSKNKGSGIIRGQIR